MSVLSEGTEVPGFSEVGDGEVGAGLDVVAGLSGATLGSVVEDPWTFGGRYTVVGTMGWGFCCTTACGGRNGSPSTGVATFWGFFSVDSSSDDGVVVVVLEASATVDTSGVAVAVSELEGLAGEPVCHTATPTKTAAIRPRAMKR
ncbi:hypothetical protein [Corynebacterium atrinae]|uniref:hypothetical protein n=1 Tax=Corynebacterium atrinae TaxID=1336740 RepID=UPI0025B30FFB|nr:hypothetical protein [Corynebacterium atrinae]